MVGEKLINLGTLFMDKMEIGNIKKLNGFIIINKTVVLKIVPKSVIP